MTAPIGDWNYPTRIRFGAGRIAELADACRAAGIERPLLVTDRGLSTNAMTTGALAALGAAGLDAALFSEIASDPTGSDVGRGCEAFTDHGADGVIAFGGGSSLDAGKAIAFHAFQTRPLSDFEDIGDNFARADAAKILPVVAVPTTAGTGSEVGRAAVIKDEDAALKRIIFHPLMLPKVVVALPTAVAEPRNIEARSNMLAASEAGATAFQRGLGAMHALAHPLGAVYGVHHGLLNAVLMPYVIAANRPAIDADAAYLARCLDVGDDAGDLLAWVLDLRRAIGIPNTLTEVGVPASEIDRIALMAVEDPSAATNPVAFTVGDYAAVLSRALAGELSKAA